VSPRVIPATWADAAAVSQVITEAFCDLVPSRWLIADAAARRQIFPGYFRIFTEHALTAGIVHTTPGHTAAALWLPTGPDGPQPPAGYDEKLAAVTGPWLARFVTFDAELDRHHRTGEAHHHLALMAVHPHHQRQGIGSALLAAHHATLDEAGIPAYLEAASARARALYARHGYAPAGQPIQLPGGPSLYPMWRPASHPAAAPEVTG
jgi:GNAT superfamily N-acetyltransferase